jgi:hypothetical protein
MKELTKISAFLFAFIILVGCAVLTPTQPPPDDFLHAKLLDVGKAMGWSLAYENKREGLFIWRLKVQTLGREHPGYECDSRFLWYMKRVGKEIWVDDPVVMQACPMFPQQMLAEVRRLQDDFKQRWLALVGPVTLKGPTPATHSAKIQAEALQSTW